MTNMRNPSKVSSSLLACILAVSALLTAQQTLPFTTIQDTLNNPDGTPFSGTVYIMWPAYQVGNTTVAAGKQSVLVTGGNLNVSLTPTDKMTPQGTFYTVSYVTNAGNPVSNVWSVPTSNTPITLNRIQPVALSSGGGSGGGGLAAPGSTGLIKYTGANTTAPATANDILNVFRSAPSPGTYVAGDGTLKPAPVVPTNVSAFTNDANYATSATLATALAAAQAASLSTTGSQGIVKTTGTGNATANAIASDVLTLFTGTQGPSSYLAGDGTLKTFPVIPTVPAVSGLVKSTGTSFTPAATTDVLSLFSGTQNSSTYLAGDATLKPFPVIPTIPNTVSTFTNDAKYVQGTLPKSTFSGVLSSIKGPSVTNIVVIGDSIMSCSQAGCPQGPTSAANTTPNIMARLLNNNGAYRHGTGLVPVIGGFGNGVSTLPREGWVMGGTLTASGSTITPGSPAPVGPYQTGSFAGYGANSALIQITGSGNYVEFNGVGDTVTLYGATFTDSGTGCTVTLDPAGTPVGMGTFGSGATASYTAISAPYSGITPQLAGHTLRIAAPTTGSCYLYGGEWSVGNQGLSVHDYAKPGAITAAFSSDPNQLAFLPLIPGGVQMVVIDLGTNDTHISTGFPDTVTTQAQYSTAVSNIISTIRTYPGMGSVPILLINPWTTSIFNNGGSSPLTPTMIKNALTALQSSTTNCELLDMSSFWSNSPTALTANGILMDNIHATDAGAQDFANRIVSLITGAVPYAGLTTSGSVNGDLSVASNTLFPVYGSGNTAHAWKVGTSGSAFYSWVDQVTKTTAASIGPYGNALGQYALYLATGAYLVWGDTYLSRTGPGTLAISGAGTVATRPGSAPVSSNSTCIAGQVTSDTSYIYSCNATNHWVRSAATSF